MREGNTTTKNGKGGGSRETILPTTRQLDLLKSTQISILQLYPNPLKGGSQLNALSST